MTAVPDPQEALREQIAQAAHRTYCIYGSCTATNQRDHAIADAVLPVVQAHAQALEDERLMDLHSSCDERWRDERDAARSDLAALRDAVSRLADSDDDQIVDAIENALDEAHGRSHYECCFNSGTFAYPSADAVKAVLRSLLGDKENGR